MVQGTTSRSQHQLELEIENMGGHLNAYTSVRWNSSDGRNETDDICSARIPYTMLKPLTRTYQPLSTSFPISYKTPSSRKAP
jgi:hypothetical protein